MVKSPMADVLLKSGGQIESDAWVAGGSKWKRRAAHPYLMSRNFDGRLQQHNIGTRLITCI